MKLQYMRDPISTKGQPRTLKYKSSFSSNAYSALVELLFNRAYLWLLAGGQFVLNSGTKVLKLS